MRYTLINLYINTLGKKMNALAQTLQQGGELLNVQKWTEAVVQAVSKKNEEVTQEFLDAIEVSKKAAAYLKLNFQEIELNGKTTVLVDKDQNLKVFNPLESDLDCFELISKGIQIQHLRSSTRNVWEIVASAGKSKASVKVQECFKSATRQAVSKLILKGITP